MSNQAGGQAKRAALIYTPLPDTETARTIAGQLLDEGLIACANILGGVESVFMWEGKRESAAECAAVFKTDEAHLAGAIERLGALHPYEVPAIAGWVCDAAHDATLGWLGAGLGA